MKIVLKLPDETYVILESESTDTIDDIKKKVNSIIQIPPDQQRIIYSGKQLVDDDTLASYNVTEGTLIYLVLRLRGGGEIERPQGKKKGKRNVYDIYNIYYGHALQSEWRDKHDKELLRLLLKDDTISGGNIQEAEWDSIRDYLNNSQNCNFGKDFLKERLREYNQWYSLLVDEPSSSIFHWDIANNFIRVKSHDGQDYEISLTGAQLSYLKCLQKLVHPDNSQLSTSRAKFRKFPKCLTRLLTCFKTG